MGRSKKPAGFTLLELMIVLAIIAIIAAVAMPSYQAHVRRSKTQEAISQLSDARVKMEHFFQDNRTYATASCDAIITSQLYFSFACSNLTGSTYTITASGKESAGMAGYTYTLTQSNARSTTLPDGTTAACWITKKGEPC